MNRKVFPKISCLIFIAICALLFDFHAVHAQDKIIAIVDNAVITQKELGDFLSFMRLQLSSEKKYSPQELENKVQSIKQDLLEKLIEDKLILQEAKKNNVRIENSLIKARILQIKKRYRSDEEFQRSLAIQGLTEADIEGKIRDQAAMYNIIEQKVKSRITISPYYANIEEFKFPEERKLKYLRTPDKNIAQQIEDSIKKGQDLNNAAKQRSLEINTLTASSKDELKAQLKEAVFKLNKDAASQAILSDGQYYIFELQEITPARQQKLSEVQDDIHRFLFEKKMQERLTSWLEELKKNSYIHIIES
jgi:parvulin-like peptidyl-prolyl isomerase